jgi:magnesium transporter
MIRRYEIDQGVLVGSEREGAPVLVYVAPTPQEKADLVAQFGLDEHTVNSSLDPSTAVILKRPQNFSAGDQFLFRVNSVGAFLVNGRIVFITAEDFPIFEGKQFQRVSSNLDILLKFIYRTIFHFYGHLKAMNAISNEIEQKINTSMENKYLINMFTVEKSLVYYLDALNSNASVIERMRNSMTRLQAAPELLDFVDDIIIENRQCSKQAEIYSNILGSLMDARASIVNNNLNVLMKTLAKITLAVMIPTFVVSAFSINVAIPFQRNPQAFLIVMGASAFSLGLLLLIFRLKKW